MNADCVCECVPPPAPAASGCYQLDAESCSWREAAPPNCAPGYLAQGCDCVRDCSIPDPTTFPGNCYVWSQEQCGWAPMDPSGCAEGTMWNSSTCRCECTVPYYDNPERCMFWDVVVCEWRSLMPPKPSSGCYHENLDACSWDLYSEACGSKEWDAELCICKCPPSHPEDHPCETYNAETCSWGPKQCPAPKILQDCNCVCPAEDPTSHRCEEQDPATCSPVDHQCEVLDSSTCLWKNPSLPCPPCKHFEQGADGSCGCVPNDPEPQPGDCYLWSTSEPCGWILSPDWMGCGMCANLVFRQNGGGVPICECEPIYNVCCDQ